jgi:hypothetical protein
MQELVTFNVNFSERTKGEFEKFDWNHRKDRVVNFLLSRGENAIFPEKLKNILFS